MAVLAAFAVRHLQLPIHMKFTCFSTRLRGQLEIAERIHLRLNRCLLPMMQDRLTGRARGIWRKTLGVSDR